MDTMNNKLKKGLIIGGIIFTIVLIMNVFRFIFGGFHSPAFGPQAGFGPHHMMGYYHHGGFFFPWFGFMFFLIVGIVVFMLVRKCPRRKAGEASTQQFIDTSLMSSHSPSSSQNENADVLDQWETNVRNKKEDE